MNTVAVFELDVYFTWTCILTWSRDHIKIHIKITLLNPGKLLAVPKFPCVEIFRKKRWPLGLVFEDAENSPNLGSNHLIRKL